MKKLLCIALVIALAASLCGCGLVKKAAAELGAKLPGSKETASSAEATEPTREETEPAEEETAAAAEETVQITFDTYTLTMTAGDTAELNVTAKEGANLKWRSSNESVVLVNSQGVITAVGAGSANVTCSDDDGSEAACTVTVTAPAATVPATTAPAAGGTTVYLFLNSGFEYLTEAEVAAKFASLTGSPISSSFAQDAINEIYARNGYVFQSADLNAYYNAQPWYTPNPSFSMGNLNKYEKANIDLFNTFK